MIHKINEQTLVGNHVKTLYLYTFLVKHNLYWLSFHIEFMNSIYYISNFLIRKLKIHW